MFVKLLSDKKENKYQYDSVVIINDYYQNYVNTKPDYEQLKFVETVKRFWTEGGGLFIFEDDNTIDKSLSN